MLKIEIIEVKNAVETMCLRGAFADFKGMAEEYAERKNSDSKTSFILGKICAMSESESISFIQYILDDWNAYSFDVINGKYKYVNLTEIVYSSWLEYKAKTRG